MQTITAKNLRDNLDEIVKRVRKGESLRVTYRSKPGFLLQPDTSGDSEVPGSKAAMLKFAKSTRHLGSSKSRPALDPDKSVKDLYHELLDNDPKYSA